MYTTLNKIREHEPCKDGWETLLKYLGKTKPDDEPLSLLTILESNGFDHTLWCLRAVDGLDKEKLLLAITYAREVEHLMPAKSKKALDVFERYVNGLATQEEFENARRAAADAADAAGDTWSAAAAAYTRAAAAEAAYAVWTAACAAADAADDAARAAYASADARAVWLAARAAYAAADAASYAAADEAARAVYADYAARAADATAAHARAADATAARAAARSTIEAKQETQLRQMLEKTCTQP